MLKTLFSGESTKAWVAGIFVALVQPLYDLLISGEELTWRTGLVALCQGLLAVALVFRVPNAPAELVDEPGQHAADR